MAQLNHLDSVLAKHFRALKRYEEEWKLTDLVLLNLCKRHPRHEDVSEINAKVMLIGRSFATGIERKIRSQGSPGSSLDQLTQHLLSHGPKIDALIASLPQKKSLEISDLENIALVHGAFVQLLQHKTYDEQAARSFASKYLHFHRPIVPIYDNVAARRLRQCIRWKAEFDPAGSDRRHDKDYRQFLFRFWQLMKKFRAKRISITTRQLDAILYITNPK